MIWKLDWCVQDIQKMFNFSYIFSKKTFSQSRVLRKITSYDFCFEKRILLLGSENPGVSEFLEVVIYLKENHSVIIFGFAVISLILSNDLSYFDNFKMWPKIDYLITIPVNKIYKEDSKK